MIVVSEIGEQWSPHTAPAIHAEMEIVIRVGFVFWNASTTIGIKIPNVQMCIRDRIMARFIFRSPSTVSEELLTYCFTWMALLAAAYVFGKREHMRMSFLADRLPAAVQKALCIVSEILVLLLAGTVTVSYTHLRSRKYSPSTSRNPSSLLLLRRT